MSPFVYRNGVLHAEEVSLARLAEEVGTPFYCYAQTAIEERYAAFAAALEGLDARICYALKPNSNLAVVRALIACGAGADVVSEGELRRALAAGAVPQDIVFDGVGKTRREMRFALEAGIGQFNVESEPELDELARVAAAMGREAPVALRVNPDVDALTHDKIATGHDETKFGIDAEAVPALWRRAQGLRGVRMVGLAVHIGSQITRLEPVSAAFARLADLVRALAADGIAVDRLDLGGGLGIAYPGQTPPSLEAYAAIVRETVGGLGCRLIFEPGRFLVGEAGVLVSRVLYLKRGRARRFLIVDAAMNDLIRPALYNAEHEIVPVAEPAANAPRMIVDVVGPVCETGDILARQRDLPELRAGELLAILQAGAYGAVMSSAYNTRPPAPEVMVRGGRFAVVRPRLDYDILLGRDRFPDWLERPAAARSSGAAS